MPKVAVPAGETPLDPRTLFDAAGDVWLEIGFGNGDHLVAQARQYPECGFIGCEAYINGVAKLLARMVATKTTNIRIQLGDARDLLDRLAPASIGRGFLLFPDPWPKKRHWKRRFVSIETIDRLADVLKPGALFRVATDSPQYGRWILARFGHHPAFEWCAEGPRDWREPGAEWSQTRYEKKARAAGRRCLYLTFRRLEGRPGAFHDRLQGALCYGQ